MKKKLSIIVPVFNEYESITELSEWIFRVVEKENIDTEIIMIDDGSTDDSWNVIKSLSSGDDRIIGIKFSKNYGKSAALQVGFEKSLGEVVITMDADMQDSPDEIPHLMKMIVEQNYDLVSGWKKKRNDPLGKTIPSKFFNLVTRKISGLQLNDFNCGLKAYKSTVVKNIYVYGEMHRYIPLIAKWSGFVRIGEKVVEHRARKYGVSKYGFKRFITGFLDLSSITFISNFKKNPMHFFGTLGGVFFLLGFFISFFLIFLKLYNIYYGLPVRDVVDQPLFYLALVAIIIGTQLFLAGFISEILTRNHIETHKKHYLIAEYTHEQI